MGRSDAPRAFADLQLSAYGCSCRRTYANYPNCVRYILWRTGKWRTCNERRKKLDNVKFICLHYSSVSGITQSFFKGRPAASKSNKIDSKIDQNRMQVKIFYLILKDFERSQLWERGRPRPHLRRARTPTFPGKVVK